MTRGRGRLIRCGLLAALFWFAIGCNGGKGSGDTGSNNGGDTGPVGPVDAASKLCADYCKRLDECGLSTGNCLAFCSAGRRLSLKNCVVGASDCNGVRACLADAGDTGMTTTDVDGGRDGGDGLDASDTSGPDGVDGRDSGMDTSSPPPDTTDTGAPVDTGTDTSTDGGSAGDTTPVPDAG